MATGQHRQVSTDPVETEHQSLPENVFSIVISTGRLQTEHLAVQKEKMSGTSEHLNNLRAFQNPHSSF